MDVDLTSITSTHTMTLISMATYMSAFFQPATYFGYDTKARPLTSQEKELAEIKRQQAEALHEAKANKRK